MLYVTTIITSITHIQTHTQITKLTLGKQLVIHFFNSAMKYLLRAWLCSLCSEEYNVVRSGGSSVNTQHPSTQWMSHDHMIQTIFVILQSAIWYVCCVMSENTLVLSNKGLWLDEIHENLHLKEFCTINNHV